MHFIHDAFRYLSNVNHLAIGLVVLVVNTCMICLGSVSTALYTATIVHDISLMIAKSAFFKSSYNVMSSPQHVDTPSSSNWPHNYCKVGPL